MGQVRFGTDQLSNPTPSKVNLWVRVFTVAGAIFLGWMATASVIGPNAKDIITQILSLFLLLANGLAPLFGVELSNKKVDASGVSAIDTDKKS